MNIAWEPAWEVPFKEGPRRVNVKLQDPEPVPQRSEDKEVQA